MLSRAEEVGITFIEIAAEWGFHTASAVRKRNWAAEATVAKDITWACPWPRADATWKA